MKRILGVLLAGALFVSSAHAQITGGGNYVTPDALSAAAAANIVIMQSQVPALAPVQSVNGLQGAVVVPTSPAVQRGTAAVSASTGLATWNFTTAFAATPVCVATVQGGVSTQSYTVQISSVSTTAVSFLVKTTANSLTISLGALSLFVNPPTGVSVAAICFVP